MARALVCRVPDTRQGAVMVYVSTNIGMEHANLIFISSKWADMIVWWLDETYGSRFTILFKTLRSADLPHEVLSTALPLIW